MDAVKLLFRHGARAGVLALFMLGYGFHAHALVVDIDITATASAEIPTEIDGETDTATSAGASDTVAAEAEVGFAGQQEEEVISNGAYARSRGNGAGTFGLAANGSDTYSATATFEQAYTITNDDPFAQALSFLFDIENGSISASCSFGLGSGCSGTDFAQASYAATITLNGAEVWNSAATVREDDAGTSFTHTGTALNPPLPPADSSYYSWAPQSFLLDLGTIEVADEWELLYSITVSALGRSVSGGCDGYYYSDCSMSYAQFGDPSGLSSTGGGTMLSSSASPIPVPAPFLLVAGGLVGIAALRRRRQNT